MHAELTISLPALYGFLAVLTRVSGALAFVPIPGIRNGPEPARAALALSLTVALAPLWPSVTPPESAVRVIAWLLSEAAFGVAVGLAVDMLIEGLVLAAQVFGLQAGYSYASTIDPTNQSDSNVLMVFAHLWGGLLFLSLGLDRQVIRIFAASLESHPPGALFLSGTAGEWLISLGGAMFSTAMRLALPVVLLLVLVDAALALMGRVHQQLQLLSLAFPAKMLAAVALLAALSPLYLPVFRGAAEQTFAVLSRFV